MKDGKICWIKSKNLQLLNDGREDKKAKGTKACVIKRTLKFENYKNYLEPPRFENKISSLKKDKFTQIVSFVTKKTIKNSYKTINQY